MWWLRGRLLKRLVFISVDLELTQSKSCVEVGEAFVKSIYRHMLQCLLPEVINSRYKPKR